MKIHFEKNQPHQHEAIDAVVQLFAGQPVGNGAASAGVELTEQGIANKLVLSDADLLANLQTVQAKHAIPLSDKLERLTFEDETGRTEATFPNFSVEMETGTGKTYVYLRTVYELHARYGFSKFVIVVPSVAIREGVLKTLQITAEHFQEIYNRVPVEFRVYDASRLSDLTNIARSSVIQILVMNIDSFAKDQNVINQTRESGVAPISFLQTIRPVVIADEPQNLETDLRKKAIANLNPMVVLRYSATHRNSYNLVYRLDPVRAYDLGLVKQIEVESILAKNDQSGAFVSLDGFRSTKNAVAARLTLWVNGRRGATPKAVTASVGDDLFTLSNQYETYRNGFVLNTIDAEAGFVEFANGQRLEKGQAAGGLTEAVLREMIDATVEIHMQKEAERAPLGIKVLTIFFIDRVANYRTYDELGNLHSGKFAQWFEESYRKWAAHPAYRALYGTIPPEMVHNGYFSQDKGRYRDSKEGKATKADDEAFRLIMRDKERLLDPAEPLRFLFSHTALREGWDNPNVFQICTLNETRSELKKRQELGRGLRLCVDENGVRCPDRNVNRLTVVANESYEAFANALQTEIQDETGVSFGNRIKKHRDTVQVRLKADWQDNPHFRELWAIFGQGLTYRVDFPNEELQKRVVNALKRMPEVNKPELVRQSAKTGFRGKTNEKLVDATLQASRSQTLEASYEVPDVVAYIQAKTGMTRATLVQALLESGRLSEVFNNPQAFMEQVTEMIRSTLNELAAESVRYEQTGRHVDIRLFEKTEGEVYADSVRAVYHPEKTPYNYLPASAMTEAMSAFLEQENVVFYIPAPDFITVPTPVGAFRPDWLVLLYNSNSMQTKVVVLAKQSASKTLKQQFARKAFLALNAELLFI